MLSPPGSVNVPTYQACISSTIIAKAHPHRNCVRLSDRLGSVGVDQSSRPECGNDLPQAGVGYREAAFTASEHAGMADHGLTHVPSAVNHDGPGRGIAVCRIEPVETHRPAVGAAIQGAGSKSTRGCCIRAGVVRKAFQPPGMGRIRPATVCHEVGIHVPVREVHHMKSRRSRRKRKIRHPDDVPVLNAIAVSIQGGHCPLQQRRSYRLALCKGARAGSRGPGGQ